MKAVLISSIIFSLVVGFGGGWWYGSVEAEKKISASIPESALNAPIQIFYGPIKEIKGEVVFIDGPKSVNPLEKLPEVREVVIGSATRILKRTQKTPAVFAEENAAYLVEIENVDPRDPTPPVAPSLFKEEILKLSDLKVGDIVSVDAGRNVREEKRFEAASITINIGMAAADENTSTSSVTSADGSMDPALTPPPEITPPPPIPPLAQ